MSFETDQHRSTYIPLQPEDLEVKMNTFSSAEAQPDYKKFDCSAMEAMFGDSRSSKDSTDGSGTYWEDKK